jgi:hypothetical protein
MFYFVVIIVIIVLSLVGEFQNFKFPENVRGVEGVVEERVGDFPKFVFNKKN